MDFKMRFTILALILAAVNAEMDDQGPQTFDTSAQEAAPSPPPPPSAPELQHEPQNEQPRYEMREVIVYLTPTQIAALQSGRGYLEPVPHPIPSDHQPNIELQQDAYDQEEHQKQLELQKTLENQQNAEEEANAFHRQHEELQKQLELQKALELQQRAENVANALHRQHEELQKQLELQKALENQQKDEEVANAIHRQHEEFQNQLELQKVLENQQDAEEVSKAIHRQQEDTARPPPPVEEPSEEEKPQEIPAQHAQYGYQAPVINQNYYVPERLESESKGYSYFKSYNKQKPSDLVNIKIFHPHPHDTKLSEELEAKNLETHIDPIFKKKFKLIPYEYMSKKPHESEQFQEQEQEFLKSLEQNKPEQQHSLLSVQREQESFDYQNYKQEEIRENDEKPEDEYMKMKYAPSYNDQKHAIEIQNLLKKQSALAKAEAIANQAPVEVHREVSVTKHQPIHIIKHIQVPVPQPYLVRVPEPYEVKVPQPYPVLQEVIRHVAIPIVRTEKIQIEKPVPYEVEKRIPVPVTKKIYVKVDKPYFVHRTVPVEVKKPIQVKIPIRKNQKYTIVKHVWGH